MKVILLRELRGRGGEGDVIDVSRGFANNYLLTQGYAVEATPGNLKQLEQRKNNIAKREEVRIAEANKTLEILDGATVNVEAQVGEEGQLFGSVTAPMVADAIKQDLDIEIDKRRIELGKPIKQVGTYPVGVNIYRTIKATINVVVSGDSEEAIEATAQAAEDAVVEALEQEVERVAEEAVAAEVAAEVAETAAEIEDAE